MAPSGHHDDGALRGVGGRTKNGRSPPAYGHSKDGRDDLTQVLLSLDVSGDGGLPLRVGLRDSNRSKSVEVPLAVAECLALGLAGVCGIVADSKASSRRPLGVCLEHGIGLVTLVPRTCAVRQAREAWGQQQSTFAQAKEAVAVAAHVQPVHAQWLAWAAEAEAAIAAYAHRRPDWRGRRPRPGGIMSYAIASWPTPAARVVGGGESRADCATPAEAGYRLGGAVEASTNPGADHG